MDYKIDRYGFPSHFTDLELQQITNKISDIIKNGNVILSQEVEDFERAFAKYNGAKFCLGCNSGTDALVLALRALEISDDDEVIVPANTFYATVLAIQKVGAKPVLVDSDESSFLINYELIEQKVTNKTKAIIAVHLYGMPCNLSKLLSICQKNGLFLIEDCAQAHGAEYYSRKVGIFGSIGCFSFHPSKNLPASGDAGACITNSPEIAEKIRILRHLGQKSQNEHVTLGMNSRLDAIQALILSERLKKLDDWNNQRRKIAAIYKTELSSYPIKFQQLYKDISHVFHLFQIKVKKRDALMNNLIEKGIDAVIRYPTPIHLQKSFAYLNYISGNFPVSETLSQSLLCLPLHPFLSDLQIEFIIDSVKKFLSKNR